MDSGELEPFNELLDPNAKWVAVPQGSDVAETPTCANRAAIVDRSERLHKTGRRFPLGKLVEAGDRIAVGTTLSYEVTAAPYPRPRC